MVPLVWGMEVLGYFLVGFLDIPAAQATVNYSFGARNWKIARLAPILTAILVLPLSIWTVSMVLYTRAVGLTNNPKLALGATLMHKNPITEGIVLPAYSLVVLLSRPKIFDSIGFIRT